MSSGLASLHNILKDETRRKIVLLLNEKGALSYTDLMNALEIANTGKLNYHLKVLNDLILKRENGHYVLTERGALASRLLLEFPEATSDQLKPRPKWGQKTWLGISISYLSFSILILAAYLLGYINLQDFFRGVIGIVSALALVVAVFVAQRHRDIIDKSQVYWKIGYIMLGGWLGATITLLGFPLFSWLSVRLGGPNILRLVDNTFEFILILSISVIAGGIAGYWLGKRKGFRRPEPKLLGHRL
jgi:hypothetical protein